jgi:hypothetical protein
MQHASTELNQLPGFQSRATWDPRRGGGGEWEGEGGGGLPPTGSLAYAAGVGGVSRSFGGGGLWQYTVHHNAQNPPPHPLLRDILGHEDAGEEGVGVCEASENTKIDECTRKDEHT